MLKIKVIVTGCAGFIGSHVSEALTARGDSVVGIDDFNDYYSPEVKRKNVEVIGGDFKLYEADIRDAEKIAEIFQKEGADAVLHLAARAGVRASLEKPMLYFETNVLGTINMLGNSKKHGIKKFVFASSSSVYGENKKIPFSESDDLRSIISPYAETKKMGEDICRYYSRFMPVVCLRFFTVYGPRGRPDMAPFKFVKLISEGKAIERYGDGTTKRDYTYIDDIVNGVIAALDADLQFEIINLGNSKPVELNRFISVIEDLLGKKAQIKQMPIQEGDVPITYADVSKAKRLLGYESTTSIEDGMKKFIEWFKENKSIYG